MLIQRSGKNIEVREADIERDSDGAIRSYSYSDGIYIHVVTKGPRVNVPQQFV